MSEQLKLLRRLSRLHEATQEGRAFVLSSRQQVASGSSQNLHIKNPSASGKTIELIDYHPSTQFRAQWTVYDELGDSVSGGTVIEPDSLLMDSAGKRNDSIIEAHENVSFDDTNEPHFSSVIPSGGAGGNSVGGQGVGTEPHIEPGREIVIEVQNDGTAERPLSIMCIYIEADRVASEN